MNVTKINQSFGMGSVVPIFLCILLNSTGFGQQSLGIIKQVRDGQYLLTPLFAEEHKFKGQIILAEEEMPTENLDFNKLFSVSPLLSAYPFRYDLHNGNIYFIQPRKSAQGYRSFFIKRYSINNLRMANSWQGKGKAPLEGLQANEFGGYFFATYPALPLDNEYKIRSIKGHAEKSDAPLLFWDIDISEKGEVQLYMLSQKKIQIWTLPHFEWKLPLKETAPVWTKIASYDADLSQPFFVINETRTGVLIMTESGDLLKIDSTGISDVEAYQEPVQQELLLIKDRSNNRHIIAEKSKVLSLENEHLVIESGAIKRMEVPSELINRSTRAIQEAATIRN